jgi:serine/threonine-protein kinase
VGSTLHDKYRIEEKLAEGGMGCVYRATHVLMEKTVAIKVLHPALAADETIVARFTREAKAASRISHPHALTVTDFGEDKGGVVFLVMEFLRGSTLKDVIRAQGPMPLQRATDIVRQVSGALEAAHEEGVVHRDLKSDNIMLEETSGSDWAKVLDFGIAKITEKDEGRNPALTAPNLIIGTPQYMSPEQCSQASQIDSRSDIYSLGIILYEMLVGHVPFTGESSTAVMMQHLQADPPNVLEERPDLPPEVADVVTRALAKRPEDRFQKASELFDALSRAAEGAASLTDVAPVAIDTDRLGVPTGANDIGRATNKDFDDDVEEATVLHAEAVRPGPAVTQPVTSEAPLASPPPPAQHFNPWRIAVPAIAVLAIIFAVVFAFQRRSSGDDADIQPSLTDPNSQPVQSLTPPTGSAETIIAPVVSVTPIAPALTATPDTSSENANVELVGTPESGAANSNRSRPEDNEETEPTPERTSTPSNRNANRRGPVVNSNSDDIPPPAPPPTQKDPPSPEAAKPNEVKSEPR